VPWGSPLDQAHLAPALDHEWIDLLSESVGFNPNSFGCRDKLIQLVRLIPFLEGNHNLVEPA
jgi:predicted ATP-dependent Lon-type protease